VHLVTTKFKWYKISSLPQLCEIHKFSVFETFLQKAQLIYIVFEIDKKIHLSSRNLSYLQFWERNWISFLCNFSGQPWASVFLKIDRRYI
jgi:hypothetical protein